MTLAVNLVRTVPSAKFICCGWCNSWCDFHVTHTYRKVMSQPKYGLIVNCGLTILTVSPFSLCCWRIMTQLRSGIVDRMASIFTKCIWQPYVCAFYNHIRKQEYDRFAVLWIHQSRRRKPHLQAAQGHLVVIAWQNSTTFSAYIIGVCRSFLKSVRNIRPPNCFSGYAPADSTSIFDIDICSCIKTNFRVQIPLTPAPATTAAGETLIGHNY